MAGDGGTHLFTLALLTCMDLFKCSTMDVLHL